MVPVKLYIEPESYVDEEDESSATRPSTREEKPKEKGFVGQNDLGLAALAGDKVIDLAQHQLEKRRRITINLAHISSWIIYMNTC